MKVQKKILLLTNGATEDEIYSVKKALTHAHQSGLTIQLSLVHIIPNLPTCYFNIPSMVTLTERYYDEAKNALSGIGDALGIQKEEQWLISGKIKTEVLRLAHKLKINFILAGSRTMPELHAVHAVQPSFIQPITQSVNF